MPTGSFEGNTTPTWRIPARGGGALVNYKALWGLLLFGWIVSYADRTLTGPVVAWMIQNKAGFIGDSANPAALGGLVGSMFFLGYMLTPVPGRRLGDRFGHREMIIVSLLWPRVLTASSGLVAGLVAFVAAPRAHRARRGRVLLQRPHADHEPHPVAEADARPGRRDRRPVDRPDRRHHRHPAPHPWGASMGWAGSLAVPSSRRGVHVVVVARRVRSSAPSWAAMRSCRRSCACIALLGADVRRDRGLFLLAETLHWPEWQTHPGRGGDRRGVHRGHRPQRAARSRGPILLNRNIWLIYIAYIAILWNLWFFSFWSVQIVKESAQSSLLAAALTAAFNAGAASSASPPAAGWPTRRCAPAQPQDARPRLHGRVLGPRADLRVEHPGRRQAVAGPARAPAVHSGLFFNALQPIVQGMTGDMVPASERGSAFGMLNLISEIGAVASPVVSGILRDATGSWSTGVYVAAGIMIISFFLYLMVNEAPAHHEDPIPA
jgi:MFS family permease